MYDLWWRNASTKRKDHTSPKEMGGWIHSFNVGLQFQTWLKADSAELSAGRIKILTMVNKRSRKRSVSWKCYRVCILYSPWLFIPPEAAVQWLTALIIANVMGMSSIQIKHLQNSSEYQLCCKLAFSYKTTKIYCTLCQLEICRKTLWLYHWINIEIKHNVHWKHMEHYLKDTNPNYKCLHHPDWWPVKLRGEKWRSCLLFHCNIHMKK